MPPSSFFATLSRRFFSSSSSSSSSLSAEKLSSGLRCINKIHPRYQAQAAQQARLVLTEYLHSTRALPFSFAELIAANSPASLAALLRRRLRFSARSFPQSLRRSLSFHPLPEFDFFLESIGADPRRASASASAAGNFFLSDDGGAALAAASALFDFGFPWTRLGRLYEAGAFRATPAELAARLDGLKKRLGLGNLGVAGACLAFPRLLGPGSCETDDEGVFEDMRRVFGEFDGASCVEGNVDAWYEVCGKIRAFYELGCEEGKVGELMCAKKEVLLACPREVLAQKADFFARFGVDKGDVGMLLIRNPEILSLDLETPAVSVLGVLEHFGLSAEELRRVSQEFPHVLGRNRMANLPHVMRALDLHQWCFDKIMSSNGRLLASYAIRFPGEGVDKAFVDALEEIEREKYCSHITSKLDFLRGIGFGESASTVKVLYRLQGAGSKLQERFDCLLGLGIRNSKACTMIRIAPRILGQKLELLEEKVNFLRQEMGMPLDYLDGFPHFLHFDLETRTKPRYRFYVWLKDQGFSLRKYSIATMLSATEKQMVERAFKFHPAAPKHYFECL